MATVLFISKYVCVVCSRRGRDARHRRVRARVRRRRAPGCLSSRRRAARLKTRASPFPTRALMPMAARDSATPRRVVHLLITRAPTRRHRMRDSTATVSRTHRAARQSLDAFPTSPTAHTAPTSARATDSRRTCARHPRVCGRQRGPRTCAFPGLTTAAAPAPPQGQVGRSTRHSHRTRQRRASTRLTRRAVWALARMRARAIHCAHGPSRSWRTARYT